MRLEMMNLKYMNKTLYLLLLLLIFSTPAVFAQEVVVTDSTAIQPKKEIVETEKDTTDGFERFKVDGVAAVVGNFVILDSDVDKLYIELKNQGASTQDVTECDLAGSLLENKLYAHHAIQDSLVVADAQIAANVDQQIAHFTRQLGSLQKVLEFYNKESEADLRAELRKINRQNMLSQQMQRQIVDAVEITPEEVRDFFQSIPEDERPVFGAEVEISQIVIEPEIPQSEIDKIISRLKEYRTDIVENGASFATKAVLHSDDQSTRSTGGQITMSRNDPFVQEFKDVAFSLEEGEVSEPFKTEFGYHILTVDRIRGQQVDVRHILLIPDVTSETVEAAKKEVDSIRQQLVSGEIEFSEAARKFSDQKETREEGGKLINPITGTTRFELTKLDPVLYRQVNELEEGEISAVLRDQDRTGRPFFKIITVTERFPEHVANYSQDYDKIKELALSNKQLEVIAEWQEEKIADTYIKVNGKYRNCDYASDWLKK